MVDGTETGVDDDELKENYEELDDDFVAKCMQDDGLGGGAEAVVLLEQRAVHLEVTGRDVVDQHFAEPVELGLGFAWGMGAKGIGEGAEASREIFALAEPAPERTLCLRVRCCCGHAV
jgi:hypothetical protein